MLAIATLVSSEAMANSKTCLLPFPRGDACFASYLNIKPGQIVPSKYKSSPNIHQKPTALLQSIQNVPATQHIHKTILHVSSHGIPISAEIHGGITLQHQLPKPLCVPLLSHLVLHVSLLSIARVAHRELRDVLLFSKLLQLGLVQEIMVGIPASKVEINPAPLSLRTEVGEESQEWTHSRPRTYQNHGHGFLRHAKPTRLQKDLHETSRFSTRQEGRALQLQGSGGQAPNPPSAQHVIHHAKCDLRLVRILQGAAG